MQIGGMYTIDFSKISKIPRFNISVKKGDTQRIIRLILLENNKALNLNNYTITVAAKKSDNTDIFNNVTIVDAELGVCEIEITEQMIAANIDLPCEIIAYGKDGSVSKTSNFVIRILDSVINEESIVSTSEFTALTKALTDILNVKIALNEKLDENSILTMKNMGQDVKEAMTGGSVAVVGVDAVLTENIKNEAVTHEKISYTTTENKFYIGTKINMELKNSTLKIVIGSGSWYLLNPDGTNHATKFFSSTTEIDVPNNNILIWDTSSGTLYTQAYETKYNPKHILLAYNYNGFKNGALENIKLSSDIGHIYKRKNSTYCIRNGQLILEETEKDYIFLKFNTFIIWKDENSNAIIKDWDTVKNELLDSSFETSPSGEIDCLKLADGESLVIDLTDNKAKIIAWRKLDMRNQLLLAQNLYGKFLRGSLSEYYTRYREQKIKLDHQKDIETCDSELSKLSESISNLNIPKVYSTQMNEVINKAYDFLGEAGEDSVCFLGFCDVHNHIKPGYISSFIKHLRERMGLSAVLFTGDIVFDIYNEEHFKRLGAEIAEHRDISLQTVGNHDVNKIPVSKKNTHIYNYFCSGYGTKNIIKTNSSSPNTSYFFYDDPKAKIRYISINLHVDLTIGAKIDTTQLKWILNVALTAPDGWGYVVFSHEPLQFEGIHGHNGQPRNGLMLLDVLNAINKKTHYNGVDEDRNEYRLDFSNKDNYVICTYAGHVHYDNLIKNDSVNVITSICYVPWKWDNAPNREIGTVSEIAIDLFLVNTRTRNCKILRIGAGKDREFNY